MSQPTQTSRDTRRGVATRRLKALLAACLAVAMAAPAAMADAPAVSAPNAKFSLEGGSIGGNGGFLGLGSYTMPLGTLYGLQFDGAIGSIDGDLLGGGGVHLFARDPSQYLLGGYGSFHSWNGVDIWRAAAEAELYHGAFTFSGLAGIEGVQGTASSNETRFFGQGYAIAFAKGSIDLKHAVNAALQAIYDKGVYAELYLRYFPVGFF